MENNAQEQEGDQHEVQFREAQPGLIPSGKEGRSVKTETVKHHDEGNHQHTGIEVPSAGGAEAVLDFEVAPAAGEASGYGGEDSEDSGKEEEQQQCAGDHHPGVHGDIQPAGQGDGRRGISTQMEGS